MTHFYACYLLALLAGVVGSSCVQAEDSVSPALAHSREEFSLTVQAPYDEAFPLFGAYEERKWAKGFDPQFIHPSPALDLPGMVFTTTRDGRSIVWTNTAFDPASGHVQYVYFVHDVMVTLIDIHLAKANAKETRVDVVYERTAMKPETSELVAQQARDDKNRDKEWAEMINGYLSKRNTNKANSQ